LQPIQVGLGSSATSQNLLKLNFDYGTTDNNGNVKSQQITVPTIGANQGFTAIQTYTYDSLNRLKDAKEMIGTNQQWKQTFTYDRFGNRNFDTANNNTTTIPNGCAVTVCNPTIDPATNKLIGYGFDSSGNTKTDASGQTFVYDAENKQVQVSNSSGIIGQYFYDGDGKRVKKVVPSTQETTIFVYDASGKMVAEYSTQLATTPQVSYLTSDHLGSPRINTDANGQVIARHDYQPFGEEIARVSYGADSTKQKFTGYERDNETDLDFAQARMYANRSGRFTTPDSYGPWAMTQEEKVGFLFEPQQWNRYLYVTNNPLKFTDPLGLERYDGLNPEQQRRVHEALEQIKKNGTDQQKAIAAFILENDVTIGLTDKDSQVTVTTDKSAADAIVTAKGPLSGGDAAKLIRLDINSKLLEGKETENSKMKLEGTLVHEGKHIDDGKNFLQDYSNAKVPWGKIRDLDNFQREDRAFTEEALYYIHRGGAYVDFGIQQHLVDRNRSDVNAINIRGNINNKYNNLDAKYTDNGSYLTKENRAMILKQMKNSKKK
jgi:RHS repeat-associated protein